MSQEQLNRYFKDTINLINDKSKEHFIDKDLNELNYKKGILDVLKSFINKVNTYESQLLFKNINEVNVLEEIDESESFSNLSINKDKFNIKKLINIPETIEQINISSEEEQEEEEDNPYSHKYNKYHYGLDMGCDMSMFNRQLSTTVYETQCCARVNNKKFKIDDYSNEFLDNYPAGVHITEDGYVIGEPCSETIPDGLFEDGVIFCDKHMCGEYEDIRDPPEEYNSEEEEEENIFNEEEENIFNEGESINIESI